MSLIRFRQSLLKTWGSCPLQAKFKDIDGLPRVQGSKAAFGTCIHAALDHYNRTGDLEQSIHLFLEVWDNPAILNVVPDVWNKYTTFGGLRQRGVEILKNYDEQQKWDTRNILFSEHRFLVPFGKHELEGTVDLGEIKKNHRGKELFRIGDYKCLTLDQPVMMAEGCERRAGDIVLGDIVVGYRNGILIPTRVEQIFDNGVRPCLSIRTAGGRSVATTADHPFLTQRGWVPANDLRPCRTAMAHDGDRVAVGLGWDGTASPKVDLDEAWLLGALIGDGSCGQAGLQFTNIDPAIVKECERVVRRLGFRWSVHTDPAVTYGISNSSGRTALNAWRDKYHVRGVSRTKIVPPLVEISGPKAWAAFLGGLLDTDGSVRVKPSWVLTWHSVNRPLLVACQRLVAMLGVNGRVEKVRANTREGVSYRLTVADRWGAYALAALLAPHVIGVKLDRLLSILDQPAPSRPSSYGWEAVMAIDELPDQATVGIQVGASTHVTGGVITHNTTTRRPNLGGLLLDIQFTTYIYASLQPEFWMGNGAGFPPVPNGEWWFQMLADIPRRGIWFHLWDNGKELDAGGRDEGDFGRLYRMCEEIERAVNADVYVPSIGEACQLCDYANGPCPVEIPTRAEYEVSHLEDEHAWL